MQTLRPSVGLSIQDYEEAKRRVAGRDWSIKPSTGRKSPSPTTMSVKDAEQVRLALLEWIRS